MTGGLGRGGLEGGSGWGWRAAVLSAVTVGLAACNHDDSTSATSTETTSELAAGEPSKSGPAPSLIPKSVPEVSPLPGTNCPADALCEPPVWPSTVPWAALVSLGCATGTVTAVEPQEWFVAPIRDDWGVDAVALCRGQTFGFQPDGLIAIEWIERSWAAGAVEALTPLATRVAWANCPLGYVSPDGELVAIPDHPPLQHEDLRTAPPGLEQGSRSLLCYGFSALARPGSADYTSFPVLAALLPFGDGGVQQGDGTVHSTADTVAALEAAYEKAAADYANTPKPR